MSEDGNGTQGTGPIFLELRDLQVYYDRPDNTDDPGGVKPSAPPGTGAAPDSTAPTTARPGHEQRFHLRVPHLRIQGGQMIGVAGRSGEGKSTLLHVLALLLRPPHLKVEYQYPHAGGHRRFVYEQPKTEVAEAELERVRNEAFGFIFQQHFLLPYFDVHDNVSLPVMVRPGFRREQLAKPVGRLLEGLGLDEQHRTKLPAQLSGGQNQRVAVARALMHKPPFLFADEPTANLDRHKREIVLRRLRAAADSGRCVVLVSHELGDLAHYCDRIFMVQENRLIHPFRGDPDGDEGSIITRPLPALVRENGQSRPRSREDANWITGEMSSLIWPADPATAQAASRLDEDQDDELPKQPPGRLGFRGNAFKYAWKEIRSRKQWIVRMVVFLLLAASTAIFSYLSSLGQGSVRYLSEATLNKPSEFLNRFIVRRKDSTNRLTVEQAEILKTKVPGLRAPPTLVQRVYQCAVYREKDEERGKPEIKYFPTSYPDGDDHLAAVSAADANTAQVGLIYLKGGPFPRGHTERAGVIVSHRFLRQTYWAYGDQADDPNLPDRKLPDELEFLMPTANGGASEEELDRRFIPGVNGRIRVPVVGVFKYPQLIIKNTVGGEESLPQMYFPEEFLRYFEIKEGKSAWQWHYAFLTRRHPDFNGKGEGEPLVKPGEVLLSATVEVEGARKPAGWVKKELDNPSSELTRALKRPFEGSLVPLPAEGDKILLRFDKARNEPSQKLIKEKFAEVVWPDVKEAAEKIGGGTAKFTVAARPISEIFPESALPKLPANEELYSGAVIRLKTFHDVLPARRVVTDEMGDAVELEPKGAQVAALERFESISGMMEWGYLGLQVTFAGILVFIIGITSYMHISSKTGDIGILRTYGLSPRSIAWVYGLELTILMVPACLLGIFAAWGTAHVTNDWWADRVVSTTAPADEMEQTAPAAKAGGAAAKDAAKDAPKTAAREAPRPPAPAKPTVFLNIQNTVWDNAQEAGKTVGLVILILTVVSILSVQFIKRQQIVDSLRSGVN